MKVDFHNPQNVTPEQFGGEDGFRLLTVEEAAILCDPAGAGTPLVEGLRKRLAPEYYHEGACRWVRYVNENTEMLNGVSYRSAAPLPQGAEDRERVTPEEFNAFALLFELLAAQNHSDMRERGFWEDRDAIEAACYQHGGERLASRARVAIDMEAIALIHTEGSEWAEGLRLGNPPDDKVPEFTAAEAEAADIIIRIMDISAGRGMRVGQAIAAKMQRNRSREKMHGKIC